MIALAAALLAQGATGLGERTYAQCAACHALEPGRNSPAGPTLHNVLGRPIASLPAFNYSPALRGFAARNPRWTRELLERYLADPEALVPGTEMGFLGMADPARRRALIDWLAAPRRNN